MENLEKRIRIFGGPNGSGKTTLFQTFKKYHSTGYFINSDIILEEILNKGFFDLNPLGIKTTADEFKLFTHKSSLLYKAKKEGFSMNVRLVDNIIINQSKKINSYESALVTSFLRNAMIKSYLSFSFETVMSHRSKLEEISMANKMGYKTYLYYISTDDFKVNETRVKNRVSKGGHNVPLSKIESRFYESLKNLNKAIKLVYRAFLFDNSGKNQILIKEFFKGKEIKIFSDYAPSWINKYTF